MTTWIGYTTLYRDGGPKLARAARTMARELADNGCEVICEAIESKREFVEAMERVANSGRKLDAMHFVGHGGMYGPMFRTTAMPEQFSPHEWRTLRLPLADDAHAYFHTCRSGRWFAPFFAQTFGVVAHGYQLYTTFSRKPDRFKWDPPTSSAGDALYVVSLPGKKSHGMLGSFMKYAGVAHVEPMLRFEPPRQSEDSSYDPVADLYDAAFADIGVRAAEIAWLEKHLPKDVEMLVDLGTGNGALLARLAPRIGRGVGLDASAAMIARAERRQQHIDNIAFEVIDGPKIPLPDRSVDVVTSLLSWRYLDWDPMMMEVRRVLKPGGRLLVVDMAALPLKLRHAPRFLLDKARQLRFHNQHKAFAGSLKQLVDDRRWQTMLKHNPIRADHEYRWYFESRFPGQRVEVITVGATSRVLAFDSGPLEPGWTAPQSYP